MNGQSPFDYHRNINRPPTPVFDFIWGWTFTVMLYTVYFLLTITENIMNFYGLDECHWPDCGTSCTKPCADKRKFVFSDHNKRFGKVIGYIVVGITILLSAGLLIYFL